MVTVHCGCHAAPDSGFFVADFLFFFPTQQRRIYIEFVPFDLTLSEVFVCTFVHFLFLQKADCTHEHELSRTIIKEMRRKLVLNLTTNRERESEERKGGRERSPIP